MDLFALPRRELRKPMPIRYQDGIPTYTKSGVYSIINLMNGKSYIGSSLCIRGRQKSHRASLRKGCHENSYLQRAWNKHGEANFAFRIVKVCSPDLTLEWEQYWIDALETSDRDKGYNICPFVDGGPMRGRKHTPESCAKMSTSQKESPGTKEAQRLATIAAAKANKGRKMNPEVVARRAATQRGRFVSDEKCQKTKDTHWTKRPDAAEIIERSAAKHRGKPLHPQHRYKMSQSLKRSWAARKARMRKSQEEQ